MNTQAAFLGSDWIAARCLSVLAEAGLISIVVTQPDRRRKRRGAAEPTAVRTRADELGLPVLATADVNDDASLEQLRAAAPGALAVVSFGQYLKRPVRELAPRGAVNLHFSLLPRWRGASPVQRAIAARDAVTGVSVQRVTAGLDAGDVLASQALPIGERDDTSGLQASLTEIGAPLLRDIVRRVLAGEELVGVAQDAAQVTLAPLVGRADARLDLAAQSAADADAVLRAYGEWPGCSLEFLRADGGHLVVRVREAYPTDASGVPGTLLGADGEGIVVAAREGALRITRVQRAGSREVSVLDFLNAWPVRAGDRVQPVD